MNTGYEGLLRRAQRQLEITPHSYVADKNLMDEIEGLLNPQYYPEIGDTFTISENKKTGDPSYTTDILTCTDVTDLSVVADRDRPLMHDMSVQVILLKSSHDFAKIEPPEKVYDLTYLMDWPTSGQFVSIWMYGGKCWSDTFKWRDGDLVRFNSETNLFELSGCNLNIGYNRIYYAVQEVE